MDPLLSTVQHLLGVPEEMEKLLNAPTRTYIRDTKAMASTPVDIKDYPNSYVFIIDMPGLKSDDIKVQVEDENVLTISGERKREEEQEVKFIRMERRVGKFMRKFTLPEDCNVDAISATCHDGVLSVTIHMSQKHEEMRARGRPPTRNARYPAVLAAAEVVEKNTEGTDSSVRFVPH